MYPKTFTQKLFSPFIINTNFRVDPDFFYNSFNLNEGWHDSNQLYKEYVSKATNGLPMNYFFVKPINKLNITSLRLISTIFKNFKINPKEFRYDFFKVLKGGSLPYHIDQKSKISICIPISENTGFTMFKDDNVTLQVKYDSMILLNNLKLHCVTPPDKDRIIFRIGIHDTTFDEVLKINSKSYFK